MFYNYYHITSLINAGTSLGLCAFVFFKNPKSLLNRTFCLFAFSVFFWASNHYIAFSAHDESTALLFNRVLMAGAMFIPSTFFHFICVLLGLNKKKKIGIIVAYFFTFIFLISDFTSSFIPSVSTKLSFEYFQNSGPMYHPFLAFFFIFTVCSHFLLFKNLRRESGTKANQIKYILIGTLIGFIGGSTNFFLVYNFPIPPFGNCFVSVYIIMLAIAIVKHQLMDIRIAISRTLIFILVYIPILLLPFFILYWQQDAMESFFGKKYWIIPTIAECILTLLGLLAYRFFEKKAERKILQEEYQHERAIKQLTKELITIETREALIQKVTHDTKQAANLTSVSLFLQDEREGSMSLHVSPPLDEGSTTSITSLRVSPPLAEGSEVETTCAPLEQAISLSSNHPILNYLKQKQDIALVEELQRSIPDNVSILHQLNAVALVPIMEKTELLGVIVLGEKTNSRVFTQIELLAFKVLAYQVGMQLISIHHMEQVKQDIINRESEKAANLENIIAGLAHNLKTPIMSSAGSVSILKEIMDKNITKKQSEKFTSWVDDIQENLEYMDNMIKSVQRQIVNSEDTFVEEITITEIISKIETLMLYEIKQNKCDLVIDNKIAKDKVLSVQVNDLLQVLNVLISNAVDSYQGKGGEIILTIEQLDNALTISVKDSGKGIPLEVQSKLFKKMVTTKGAQGRGLGLYLVYPVVKGRLNGDIAFESSFGNGTCFILNIPIDRIFLIGKI